VGEKAKDLSVWQLRTGWYGSLAALVEELKTINLEQPANEYLEAQQRYQGWKDKEILTFEQAAKVTRAMILLVGKPNSYGLVWMRFKNAVTSKNYGKTESYRVTWKSMPLNKALEVSEILGSGKIPHGMSKKGGLEIYYPADCPPSIFYTSTLPAIWKKKQAQKSKMKQIREVDKKLARK